LEDTLLHTQFRWPCTAETGNSGDGYQYRPAMQALAWQKHGNVKNVYQPKR